MASVSHLLLCCEVDDPSALVSLGFTPGPTSSQLATQGGSLQRSEGPRMCPLGTASLRYGSVYRVSSYNVPVIAYLLCCRISPLYSRSQRSLESHS